MSENYSFSAGFALNSESLIMGQEAAVIVRPNLRVNNRICELSLLKNCKATLTTYNFIDNTPVTKIFDGLKVDANSEARVEFQVPPNISSCEVHFEAELTNVTLGQKMKVSAQKSFPICSHAGDVQFCEAFLRKTRDGYQFFLLGKNGEPKPGVEVSFVFRNYMYPDHS